MLTVVLTGDKRRPSGQGPGTRLRNGLASQRSSASRAARAHRRSPVRPAPPDQPSRQSPARNRATERQRPAPDNSPQPRTNSQGSATAAAIRLRRSFHAAGQPAAFLIRAGPLIVWLPLNVSGCRPVLARGWHEVRPSMRTMGACQDRSVSGR